MHIKIRNIVITLMAACSFASMAAPVASAESKQGSSYDCAGGKTWFDSSVTTYEKLKGEGNTKAAGDAKKDAENEKTRAKEAGCDVSTWKVPAIKVLNPRVALVKQQITVTAPVPTRPSPVVITAANSVALG